MVKSLCHIGVCQAQPCLPKRELLRLAQIRPADGPSTPCNCIIENFGYHDYANSGRLELLEGDDARDGRRSRLPGAVGAYQSVLQVLLLPRKGLECHLLPGCQHHEPDHVPGPAPLRPGPRVRRRRRGEEALFEKWGWSQPFRLAGCAPLRFLPLSVSEMCLAREALGGRSSLGDVHWRSRALDADRLAAPGRSILTLPAASI